MNKSFYFNITYACNSRCIFCAARDFKLKPIPDDMTVEQFEDILQKNRVGKGDRVIINGGEPTIHDHFFLFLDLIRKRGASIILFTNGIKLKDREFVKRLMLFQPLNIRIPFFGARAIEHDALTGLKGNFDKTLQGFSNIVKNIQTGAAVQLEAKLLLCKATYKNNLAIVKLLIQCFHKNFYFSINPLIYSEKVLNHAELLLETFSKMKKETRKVIELIRRRNFVVSLNQLPFCLFYNSFPDLFPSDAHALYEKWYFDTLTWDSGKKTPLGSDIQLKTCKPCKFRRACIGFYSEYVNFHGQNEARAIISKRKLTSQKKPHLLKLDNKELKVSFHENNITKLNQRGGFTVNLAVK
jgi:MoaA/NifB/PqqE/SkfB family radical SAM enzyme